MRTNSNVYSVFRHYPDGRVAEVCVNSIAVCIAYVSREIKQIPEYNHTYHIRSTDKSKNLYIDHNNTFVNEDVWKTVQVVLGYKANTFSYNTTGTNTSRMSPKGLRPSRI